MDDDNDNGIEEVIEDLPQEVKDFMFGPEMVTVKQSLFEQVQDQQKADELSMNLDLFVFGMETYEDVDQFIESLPIDQTKKIAIRDIIVSKVVKELLLLIQVHEELDAEATQKERTTTPAPSPSDVLTSLKARLTTSTSIAPVTRELPPGPGITSVTSPDAATAKPSAPRPTIDPYREIPK